MKKIGIALAFLLLVLSTLGMSCNGGNARQPTPVSIGTTISEVNSLIVVAEEQGYFRSNGIELTHKIYPSGVAALNGMLNGEVDLATGSEFAFAGQVLAGKDLRTLSSISRSSIEHLVARSDRGISRLEDLRGKTIGVPMGSRPEFALDRFLLIRGIDASAVTMVNVPVNKSVEALINGDVDAVAAWQPYIDRVTEEMGDGVVVWEVQEDQPSYTLVMSGGEWISRNSRVIERFLKSLAQAEDYVSRNADAAMVMIQGKSDYDAAYMASVWPEYDLSLSLDRALIVAMEDQARWIIGKDPAIEAETPNFVRYMYTDGLNAIRPDAVNIIE